MPADSNNLLHVISERPCTDPDCELHNPWVGIEEETVSFTNAAFYLAGARAVRDAFLFAELDVPPDSDDEPRLDAAIKHLQARIMTSIHD